MPIRRLSFLPRGLDRPGLRHVFPILAALILLWLPTPTAAQGACAMFGLRGDGEIEVLKPGESCVFTGARVDEGGVRTAFYTSNDLDLGPDAGSRNQYIAQSFGHGAEYLGDNHALGYTLPKEIYFFYSSILYKKSVVAVTRNFGTDDANACFIALFSENETHPFSSLDRDGDGPRFYLAHEYVHCLVFKNARAEASAAGYRWWNEGLANALARGADPDTDMANEAGVAFAQASRGSDMIEQEYTNEPFIAWLLQRASWLTGTPPAGRLKTFVSTMPDGPADDSMTADRGLQRHALSEVMTRGDAARFMMAYADGKLTTLAGLPYGGAPAPAEGPTLLLNASLRSVTLPMPSFGVVHQTIRLDMPAGRKGEVAVGLRDPANAPMVMWKRAGTETWLAANATTAIAMGCGGHLDLVVAGMSTEVAAQEVELRFTPGATEPCDENAPGGGTGSSGANGTTPAPPDGGSKPPPSPPAPPPPPGPPAPPPPGPPGPGGGSTGGQGGQKPPSGGGGQTQPPPNFEEPPGGWDGEIPYDERTAGWRPPADGWRLGEGSGRRPGGHGNGDPHYLTGDGVFYSTQHVGEFWALNGPEDMAIQVRQSPWKDSDTVASISAVALRIGPARVSLSALPRPALWVEGRPVAAGAPFQRIALAGGGRLEVSSQDGAPHTVLAVWADGSTAQMDLLDSWIDLDVELARERPTSGHRGLLGSADGDPANDLRPRSGPTLPPDRVAAFVNGWRIRPEESLFDYPPGRTAASYQDLAFPREPGAPTAQALAGARRTCAARGVSDPVVLAACAFDLAMTGETGLLDSHRGRQRQLERIRGVFERELDPDIGGARPLASDTLVEMRLGPGDSRTFFVDVPVAQRLVAHPEEMTCVSDYDGDAPGYQWFDVRGRPLSTAKMTCSDLAGEEVGPGRYYLVVRGPRTGAAVRVAVKAYLVE